MVTNHFITILEIIFIASSEIKGIIEYTDNNIDFFL